MPNDSTEQTTMIEVVNLLPKGLGFGKGSISPEARIQSGEITRDDLAKSGEIIRTKPEVFVAVDADAQDDGCGDGRRVARVLRLNAQTDVIEELNKSRRRAKIFGGGLMVASSMWRSICGAPRHGETVLADRQFIAGKLKELNIAHGAHTATGAEGDNCGCGAIDHYVEMTEDAVTYKTQILEVLKAMYGESFDDNLASIKSVFEIYGVLADDEMYFSNAQGAKTRDLVASTGSVVKELADSHREGKIVLNDVDGTTFDQRKFEDLLQEAGVSAEIQVFVVDTWRGRMYAEAMAKVAADTLEGVSYEEALQKAYADFLIRTLAIAASLTQGDLEVNVRLRDGKSDFSLAA